MHWWQIALSIVAGLGVGGLLAGLFDRRHASREAQKARDHATTEARAGRRMEIRFDAYQKISVYLERLSLWVKLIEPDIGHNLEPPDVSPSETWIEVGGLVGVTASDEVRAALTASREAVAAFQYAVSEVREAPDGSWEPGSDSPRLKLFHARERAVASIVAAQTAMRDELLAL